MSLIENESRSLPVPDDSDELLLIGYMDNELQPEQRRMLEKRLTEEPLLRQKLAEFEKTWNILDFLETQRTNREQVYSTLELIALQVENSAKFLAASQSKIRAIRSFFLWAFLFLLVFLGYQTVDQLHRAGEKQKMNDLLLIERLDQYLLLDQSERMSPEIDEIEFLRQLHQSNILD